MRFLVNQPPLHHRAHTDVVEVPDLRLAQTDGKRRKPGGCGSFFGGRGPRFAQGKLVPIVLTSKSLLRRRTMVNGRLLRDRPLSGFCMHLACCAAKKIKPSRPNRHGPASVAASAIWSEA